MEPEINQETIEQEVQEKSSLHTVTPLSKYLAMVLFVILPFIGGWIGYQYAPEKIVEIERVVISETLSEENIADTTSKTYQNIVGRYSFSVPDGYLALDHNFLDVVADSDSGYDSQTLKELYDVTFDVKALEDSQVLLVGKSGQNQYFDLVMRFADFSHLLEATDTESYYKSVWEEMLAQNTDPNIESVVYEIDNINGHRTLGVKTIVYNKITKDIEMYRFSGVLIGENRVIMVQIDVPEGRGVDVDSFDKEKLVREFNGVVESFRFN